MLHVRKLIEVCKEVEDLCPFRGVPSSNFSINIDPNKKHGVLYRANERFSRSRLGVAYALGPGSRIDPWLFQATGGRYPWILGTNATAPLTTMGAKSGLSGEVQVTYFHDGPSPILIASNGGRATHPHWYHNLTAHPECELGDEHFSATEVTDPDERTRLFALADRVFAGYADYRERAALTGRQIPVFRLEQRPALPLVRSTPQMASVHGAPHPLREGRVPERHLVCRAAATRLGSGPVGAPPWRGLTTVGSTPYTLKRNSTEPGG